MLNLTQKLPLIVVAVRPKGYLHVFYILRIHFANRQTVIITLLFASYVICVQYPLYICFYFVSNNETP